MADAAAEFLLENLQQLLLYHVHLISDAKNQVEKLENDLRLFKAFLKDSTRQRRNDDGLRELVRQIRDVVYEAEDIIDAFITQAADSKSRSYLHRAFSGPVKLLSIAKDVEAIGDKVRDIYGDRNRFDFANTNQAEGAPEANEGMQCRYYYWIDPEVPLPVKDYINDLTKRIKVQDQIIQRSEKIRKCLILCTVLSWITTMYCVYSIQLLVPTGDDGLFHIPPTFPVCDEPLHVRIRERDYKKTYNARWSVED